MSDYNEVYEEYEDGVEEEEIASSGYGEGYFEPAPYVGDGAGSDDLLGNKQSRTLPRHQRAERTAASRQRQRLHVLHHRGGD